MLRANDPRDISCRAPGLSAQKQKKSERSEERPAQFQVTRRLGGEAPRVLSPRNFGYPVNARETIRGNFEATFRRTTSCVRSVEREPAIGSKRQRRRFKTAARARIVLHGISPAAESRAAIQQCLSAN
jgi:hypothetical protein